MSVIGIVCEFNPFHNGHKYLIDSVKQQDDIVVCVMSGNFVQRGEPAIFPKEARVKAALLNGADIVLELPFVYATASAELFSYSAVKILDAFGCDKIAFGTENASVEDITKCVEIISDESFDDRIKKYLKKGMSYPSARQSAINEHLNKFDVSTPNNILAVEYVKAIKKLKSHMIPVAVNRIGAGYNDNFSVDNIASATFIRSLVRKKDSFENFVPENTIELYSDCIANGHVVSMDKYNLTSLALLRAKLSLDSVNIANMAEGLENRINNAVNTSINLDEIYDKAKTKRYTHSRIRRAVLCRQFDVEISDLEIDVPYCRLLGFNKESTKNLGILANDCSLPFISKYSDITKYDNNVRIIFEFEEKTTDFYNLVLGNTEICSKEKTYSPIKV